MSIIRNRITRILIALLVLSLLSGCVTYLPESGRVQKTEATTETRNLQKLAKVWGFAKYTHPAFLSGRLCWDEELLALLPIVRAADCADVNDILYEWYIGLGTYESGWRHVQALMDRLELFSMTELMYELAALYHGSGIVDWEAVDAAISSYPYNRRILSGIGWGWTGEEENILEQADLTWINADFLGAPLAEALSRFEGTQNFFDRSDAPVFFDRWGRADFRNQSHRPGMDVTCPQNRLLGLFRMWNTVNYYFPYLDTLDRDWNGLLLEFIPEMLDVTGSRIHDRHTYERALAALSAHMHDAHAGFNRPILAEIFGNYAAPVRLIRADGRIVVRQIIPGHISPLEPGDVLLSVDGVDIDDVVAERMRYSSVPIYEKIMARLGGYILRSHDRNIEVKVLRENSELTLTVPARWGSALNFFPQPTVRGTELPEHNIGLINPARISEQDAYHAIMRGFADTDGLIIDLRERPASFTFIQEMAEYLLPEPQRYVIFARPAQVIPGAFLYRHQYVVGPQSPEAFFYERPVVLLMNEWTFSYSESCVMALRAGPNVTVLGSNSIGSNGDVKLLPLPGNITFRFSGIGVFTPEGGQTQRVGLIPDILVYPTAAGVREGRDELIEAAIEFISR